MLFGKITQFRKWLNSIRAVLKKKLKYSEDRQKEIPPKGHEGKSLFNYERYSTSKSPLNVSTVTNSTK